MIIALYIAAVAADGLRAAGNAWIPVRLALALLVLLIVFLGVVPEWVLLVAVVTYASVAVWNFSVIRRFGGRL